MKKAFDEYRGWVWVKIHLSKEKERILELHSLIKDFVIENSLRDDMGSYIDNSGDVFLFSKDIELIKAVRSNNFFLTVLNDEDVPQNELHVFVAGPWSE